jgi:signal transduction histidine kinase
MPGSSGSEVLVLLDQLPAVVWATDRDLRLTYAHGAAVKHFGPRGDELIAAEESGSGRSAHRAALGGGATTCEYEWRGRVFHAHVQPRWEGTAITGTIGVALDVSDRVRSQVLDSVARLANAVAHEINNPLLVILAQLEMLAAVVRPEELYRIESCRLAIERMTGVVDNMSRLTRLEAATGWPPDLPAMLDLRRSARPRD